MIEEIKNETEKYGCPVSAMETAVEKQHSGSYLSFAVAMLNYAEESREGNAALWALEKLREATFLKEWSDACQPSIYLDIKIPDYMTREQAQAVLSLWKRNHDGCPNFAYFLKHRVSSGGISKDSWIAVNPWCGIYIGIEKDGYAHS